MLSSMRMPLHLLVDLLPLASLPSVTSFVVAAKRPNKENASVRLVQAQAKILPRKIMYTCQWAFQERGKVQRRFFCFATTKEYLEFFQGWVASQATTAKSSLMECTSGEQPRKWVIDIDAPVPSPAPKARREEMHQQVMQLAKDTCARLYAIGFVMERPPDFVILTRHREDKLSWHVVLLVLAPYSRWRAVMMAIDADLRAAHKKIAPFIDAAVLRNSKGQYMQTLYSCKPLQEQGFVFNFASFEISSTTWSSKPILLQELVSSMLLPDPFSLLSLSSVPREQAKEAQRPKREEGKSKRAKHEDGEEKEVPQLVRDILQNENTTYMPVESVRRPPLVVQQLLEAGSARVTWAAQVLSPKVCPRALVQQGILRKHTNNHVLAMAITTTDTNDERLFALCFSEKCRQHTTKKAWVELTTSSKTRLLLLSL